MSTMPGCQPSCSAWPPKPRHEARPPFADRHRRLAKVACPGAAEVWLPRYCRKTANPRSRPGTYLAENPQCGFRDPRRKFHHYPVSGTPFTVVYEYDDAELRVLFIVHQRTDRRRLDSSAVEW